ncbi:probable starch synthase 4, chloroplastic/amyloplastic isoform X3 [Musa acuminata AAA Group]|uniref:probable starch synthase 4, chloroplastic/amyloplastic isoform X3 n=1 Tax=Musa acuminata AAA Group TaxID=214697 RepID=UPI0031D31405
MASVASSLVLGRGFSCAKTPTRPPIACLRLSRAVSCKMRNRHLSSQQKRQQFKRAPTELLSLNMNAQSHDNIGCEPEEASSAGVSHSSQITIPSNDAESDSNSETDVAVSSSEETNMVIENNDEQEHPSIHLEDLIATIRNAEKIEELDKILSEKEALQAEINNLEMKLAETDARIKVAAQEKINAELLENQLEKLKTEISSRNSIEEGKHGTLELNDLRKENALLKDDIQMLKLKLADVSKTEERLPLLEKRHSLLEASLMELQSQLSNAQDDVSRLASLRYECKALLDKVENLQALFNDASRVMDQPTLGLQQYHELQKKVDKIEALVTEATVSKFPSENFHHYDETLREKIELLEKQLWESDQEIHSQIQLFQESVREFHDALERLKEEIEKRSQELSLENLPQEFWSRLLLIIDGWLLEKKISVNDAKLLREMTWKKDAQIRDAYLASRSKSEHEKLATFLKLTYSRTSPGMHIIHIAAEMAPVAKVGGLGDVISGLGKALQRKGHVVEIVLPKYDCMQYDLITDMKALDVVVESYFDGQLFRNKIWVGIIEGLPVYFIEPHHPAKFFWRGKYYGEYDDFKRFSFFSRAAVELLYQAGKKPDIIHCHDWQTAFVAPLYWDIYAAKGFNSARICFTCHNFEYQGTAPASELASCGLDVHQLNRPDRMRDHSADDKVNTVKGAIVFSNIVTTVSPTYSQEVRTVEGGRGLHETLKSHSKKFIGILNGIDTDAWNPSTDNYISVHYSADDLQGKAENKDAIRKCLKLSRSEGSQPLVGCITRLVPQKGVHLIRHAIYCALELGGQFVLLGSSPVPHIQREFEDIANHFQSHSHVRLLLKYDDALSHLIYAASDMFIIPSMFEPCGLTQMIAMRYGSVPIVRKTGGLNDSVFDVDDNTIPEQYQNGFTFVAPDEQGLSSAMERAFQHYIRSPESWQQLVQKDMRLDFSWDSSASQYEELYERSVARARAAARV